MPVNVFLYAPEYRPNLSNMVRSAEFFGLKTIFIYDKNGLLKKPESKNQRADYEHMVRVWTAGAVDHINVEVIDDVQVFFREYVGRKIATIVDERGEKLAEFNFKPNDLIIMGPEKEGLPHSIRVLCEKKVHLPNIGETDCLNVSVMLGITLYAAQNQTR